MEADRGEHAVNFYTKAIMLDPSNPNDFIQRARCRLKLKQFDQSQHELADALERFPEKFGRQARSRTPAVLHFADT
ncbi:hypothetical protein QW131_05520 [Roseibium salinum]|nr:hypothetical protein [Roseibium salinum]